MRFGLVMPNEFDRRTSPTTAWADVVTMATAAEDAGFDAIWVAQHYLGNMATLQPLATLAALSQHTRRIRLGTNIFILPLHPTVQVAEAFATLDTISDGRVIAGLGLGYREHEFAASGADHRSRADDFEHAVGLLRQLWAGEAVSHRGAREVLQNAALSILPVQARLPVWVGSGAHRTGATRAGRLGEGWIIPPSATVGRIAELMPYFIASAEQAGRPGGRVAAIREVFLDRDPERARAIALPDRTTLTQAYSAYSAPDQTAAYRALRTGDLGERVRDLAEEAYLFTDPDTCLERLRVLQQVGITDVLVRMRWAGLHLDQVLGSLELFRTHVLPRMHV